MANKKRLTDTFLKLARIDSPTGKEREVGDFVFREISSIGIKPERDKIGNIIAKIPGKDPPLFLSAHLDTVQSKGKIEPVLKKGMIESRGDTILGADNKAAIAAILESLRSLKKGARRLEVVFTVSEESENLGSLALNYSRLESKYGFCFDCGEKIGTVVLKSPFYDSFNISIKGRSSHAASPEKGVNALSSAVHAISKIRTGRIDNSSVLNIGKISGGDAVNIIPGRIDLQGEIRSFKKDTIEKHEEKLRNVFKKACLPAKAEVRIKRENGGYVFSKNDDHLRETKRIFSMLKIKVLHKNSWTCSDANIFNEKGIKVLNLGDGVENIHGINERIAVKDLVSLSSLIKTLVEYYSFY